MTYSGRAWGSLFCVMGLCGLASAGCTVGEGEGWVRSERLNIEDCWNGEFELQPTFYGANPYRESSLLIRVQRGDNWEELSDGLTVLVSDIDAIRGSGQRIGQAVPVGLPPGVSPPGVPIKFNPDPPIVSLTLYLHQTCHLENGAIYSTSGNIVFDSLFSGDPNEKRSEDRLTDAHFEDVIFSDPRDLNAEAEGRASRVSGSFRFFFQRGQPAQPFP